MNKIGIMGGSFNPIHNGHLLLAENAYEQIGLDKILFMPSNNPPHKEKFKDITDQQRVDMISLAISDNSHFELSTTELSREGLTYTADTLTILRKTNPNTEYYFIVGADSLFMMQKWKEPQIIFNLCTVVVASRDNVEKEQMQQHAVYLKSMFSANILLINLPTIQISSANIRERVATNKTIRYYVPSAVSDYIINNRLYHTKLEELQEWI